MALCQALVDDRSLMHAISVCTAWRNLLVSEELWRRRAVAKFGVLHAPCTLPPRTASTRAQALHEMAHPFERALTRGMHFDCDCGVGMSRIGWVQGFGFNACPSPCNALRTSPPYTKAPGLVHPWVDVGRCVDEAELGKWGPQLA